MKTLSSGFITNSSTVVATATLSIDDYEKAFVESDLVEKLLDTFSDRNWIEVRINPDEGTVTFIFDSENDHMPDCWDNIKESIKAAKEIFESYGLEASFESFRD